MYIVLLKYIFQPKRYFNRWYYRLNKYIVKKSLNNKKLLLEQEKLNKLKVRLNILINKILEKKEKNILNKTQLKDIIQLIKIITKKKIKSIIDEKQLSNVINIINNKELKNGDKIKEKKKKELSFRSAKILQRRRRHFFGGVRRLPKEKDDIDIKFLNLLLIYHKMIYKIAQWNDDSSAYALIYSNEIIEIRKELQFVLQNYLQNNFVFWYPGLDFQKSNNTLNIITSWTLYICLKIPLTWEQVKTSYKSLFKRQHLFKLCITSPWGFVRESHRYSRHLIIYTKRLLCYHNIIASNPKSYQYPSFDIDIYNDSYISSDLKSCILAIFLDIKHCLIEGLYDKYILTSINKVEEVRLETKKIDKWMLDQLNFTNLNIKLILLKEDIPFHYIWL